MSDIHFGHNRKFQKCKELPLLNQRFQNLVKKACQFEAHLCWWRLLIGRNKRNGRSHGLEKNLIFTGYSKNVAEYLSLMNIFVLCSLQEGLPNVLLQAMSMELPVISSDVGGCSEIIDHMTNGILYPSNNLDKFIEAVEMLIEDRIFASKTWSQCKANR